MPEAIIDLLAFTSGVECFARIDFDATTIPPHEPLSVIMNQFDALMKRVVMKPQFEFLYFRPFPTEKEAKDPQLQFMEQTRSRVLKTVSRKKLLRKSYMPTVLDAFFARLQLEKLEDKVEEKAMVDLHAFVSGGVDYFAYMEDLDYPATIMPPHERPSVMMMNGPPLGSRSTEYRARDQEVSSPIRFRRKLPLPDLRGLISTGSGITVKELAIIKLTAQFYAMFGRIFLRGVKERL
ncbi:hypothetical protein EUTSA_v10015956mg, partial [Eutrema salsugineum]